MLAALLLGSILAAPIVTFAVFVRPRSRGNPVGALATARRLANSLLGAAVLAIIVYFALRGLGATRRNADAAAVAIVVSVAAFLPITARWYGRARVCWGVAVLLSATYLAFMLRWTFESGLSPVGVAGGLVLWTLELIAAVLSLAYLWEMCDALGSAVWRRRIRQGARQPRPAGEMPFVSLHVPAHNEPPGMVIETLHQLIDLEYPAYEIIALDDNTPDDALWRPVEQWCGQHGVKFFHLQDWPGYKSGALNFALTKVDPRTELAGVVDSDYQIEPDFLWRCAPLFDDPRVGFIQAPQDYREWQHTPYLRRLFYSYKYFFSVTQPSRNERNGAIFAGTMGLIRRRALDEVGGWDEWCITEDAELSLRLLRAGYEGLHVDRSFGHGVMPLTFEALKSQRFRWCFGGVQLLRIHARDLLGRGKAPNRLTLSQRITYLAGSLQWFGDLLGLAFFVLLLAGAFNLGFGSGVLFRRLSGFLLFIVPLYVVMGLFRAVALVRRSTRASWADAIGAFLIWQSLSLTVVRASVRGLFAKQGEFMRTPKTGEDLRWFDAFRTNKAETFFALLGFAGMGVSLLRLHGWAGPLLAGLLVPGTVSYASAPINSLAAIRAALPPELQARRRTEWLRDRTGVRAAATATVFAASGAAATLLAVVLWPTHAPSHSPDIIGPAQGKPPASSPAGPSGSPTPSRSSPGSSPTPSPSPSGSPSSASPSSASPSSSSPSPTSASPAASTAAPTATPTPTPTATPTPAATAAAPAGAPPTG